MSNIRMPIKWVNTSTLMMFECCFLISNYHDNYNVMSSFTALHHVPQKTFICSAAQYFYQFVIVICLLCFFSDAPDNERSQLVEIPIERSIFECNIQKTIPRSLQLKKYYLTFKNRSVQLRFEITMTDTSRDQLLTNNKLPAFRVGLKISTGFIFKLVLKVSGRSVR